MPSTPAIVGLLHRRSLSYNSGQPSRSGLGTWPVDAARNLPQGKVRMPRDGGTMRAEPELGTWPDPERLRLIRCATHASPLDSVAEAVSVASEHHRILYVERDGVGWRWSLATRGGPYPLIRITAQFLRCKDHWRLVVPYRTLDNGLCVLDRSEDESRTVSWTVLEFDAPVSPGEAVKRIFDALGGISN